MDAASKLQEAISAYARRNGIEGKPRFRAALIDMDGTLYDSMGNHTASWHRMMKEHGIDEPRERFYLYEGMTGANTIRRLFRQYLDRDVTDEEVKELYHLKTVYFSELPPVKPMAGAKRMLEILIEMGITRVLVTGSGQRSLIDRLQRDFPGAFSEDLMVTSANVVHGKPHPEPYLKAMEMASVKPIESVVIENAPIGVQAGHASGAFTVALTTGPIPAATLAAAGADIVLPSMEVFASVAPLLFK